MGTHIRGVGDQTIAGRPPMALEARGFEHITRVGGSTQIERDRMGGARTACSDGAGKACLHGALHMPADHPFHL